MLQTKSPLWLRSVTLALALTAGGCQDAPTTPAVMEKGDASAAPAVDHLEPITRTLAAALQDPFLRRKLLEDFRDSPFPKHKIHLQSYLRGASGRMFLHAGGAGAGTAGQQVMALLDSLPDLEILVPSDLDRLRWTGTGEIAVVGSTLSGDVIPSAARVTGYTTAGQAVSFGLFERPELPIVAIYPVQTDFGSDPERVRRSAPRKNRGTISEPGDGSDVSPMYMPPPDCTTPDCAPSGHQGPGTGAVTIPTSFSVCRREVYTTLPDADADGITDQCEYELAYAFRPYLSVHPQDPGLGREEYWAVKKTPFGGHYMIFYAYGYYIDGGEDDTGRTSHLGDSEWVILYVTPYFIESTGSLGWELISAKLSAHWGELSDATTTYPWYQMFYPDGVAGGRPLVYVAKSKHANYNSRSNCDAAAFMTDSCNSNSYLLNSAYHAINVYPDRNLGQSTYSLIGGPEGCVHSRGSSVYPGPYVTTSAFTLECFWGAGSKFKGWQGSTLYYSGSASVYRDALVAHSF